MSALVKTASAITALRSRWSEDFGQLDLNLGLNPSGVAVPQELGAFPQCGPFTRDDALVNKRIHDLVLCSMRQV